MKSRGPAAQTRFHQNSRFHMLSLHVLKPVGKHDCNLVDLQPASVWVVTLGCLETCLLSCYLAAWMWTPSSVSVCHGNQAFFIFLLLDPITQLLIEVMGGISFKMFRTFKVFIAHKQHWSLGDGRWIIPTSSFGIMTGIRVSDQILRKLCLQAAMQILLWHRLGRPASRTDIPVVPHKPVAEVSEIGNLQEGLVVATHGWQSESIDGPKGGWSCVFWSVRNGCSGHLATTAGCSVV